MISRSFALISLAFSFLSSVVYAQSAADIAAQVDSGMEELEAFEALLNDPDPARSLKAMNIMVAHENPEISRMALQFGLTSTSPAVRRAALQAYLDTGPVLNIFIDGSSLDRPALVKALSTGTVDENGSAFLSHKVGAFDPGKGCFKYEAFASYCLVTLAESNVGLSMWNRWTTLTLNDEGILTGSIQVGNLTPSVPVTIPIRP